MNLWIWWSFSESLEFRLRRFEVFRRLESPQISRYLQALWDFFLSWLEFGQELGLLRPRFQAEWQWLVNWKGFECSSWVLSLQVLVFQCFPFWPCANSVSCVGFFLISFWSLEAQLLGGRCSHPPSRSGGAGFPRRALCRRHARGGTTWISRRAIWEDLQMDSCAMDAGSHWGTVCTTCGSQDMLRILRTCSGCSLQ